MSQRNKPDLIIMGIDADSQTIPDYARMLSNIILPDIMVEKLNRRQEEFLAFKLWGLSDKDACIKAGITMTTRRKWLKTEDFSEAYNTICKSQLAFAIQSAAPFMARAVARLVQLIDCPDPRWALEAIKTYFNFVGAMDTNSGVTINIGEDFVREAKRAIEEVDPQGLPFIEGVILDEFPINELREGREEFNEARNSAGAVEAEKPNNRLPVFS